MKRSVGDHIFDTFNIVLLALLALITLLPFWTLIMSSFVGPREYFSKAMVLWPSDPNISAFRFLFGTDWIFHGYRVSFIVTIFGTLHSMLLVLTCAYPMSSDDLPGRKGIHYYFLFTMFFGGGMIPYFILVTRYLRLTDNLLALIITNGLPVWSYLVMRNFIKNIPSEMRESAILDGATEWQVLKNVIIPLPMPAIATLTLFSAVGNWNAWMNALLFINSDKNLPLPLILRRIVIDANERAGSPGYQEMMNAYRRYMGDGTQDVFDTAVQNATIAVTALPIMCLYPFFQKHFVKGVLLGSVKG